MSTKIPQRLKNTFRRRNVRKSEAGDSGDESTINQTFETYDMSDIFSFEKEDEIFSTIRSNDPTEAFKVLISPPLSELSDKKKDSSFDIPSNILSILDSTMERQKRKQNKKKEANIQHNQILKAQSEYMERDVSNRAKAKSEWKRRLRQRKIDLFREEQRNNNICANTELFNHGIHINEKNYENELGQNTRYSKTKKSNNKNSSFEDKIASNLNVVNSESKNNAFYINDQTFSTCTLIRDSYPNQNDSESSKIHLFNDSSLTLSNNTNNKRILEMEKNLFGPHIKSNMTQSESSYQSGTSFNTHPNSIEPNLESETHLSFYNLDSDMNSNKKDLDIITPMNQTNKLEQIPIKISQLQEKPDFEPAVIDLRKSRSCPRTSDSFSDSSTELHKKHEIMNESSDGNMPSVKNLRKWLNNFETKNKEYQRNIGNRETLTKINNKKMTLKDITMHEPKSSLYRPNESMESANSSLNLRSIDVKINCDENKMNTKEYAQIEFRQSSLRRNVVIRSSHDPSKCTSFRFSSETSVNSPPQRKTERTKPNIERMKTSTIHRSSSYGSIVDLYPNTSKNVKSYVPVQKPIKQKIDKKDVAATNETRVSVSKISEWLSNDPFETKKSKTIKRGMNVMMKSLKFEPDQRSPVNIEVIDRIGGNVSDRKKWIENCFKKNVDDKDESSNSNKVADRARWLQEEAFSKQTARF